jgi:hypothetical protein
LPFLLSKPGAHCASAAPPEPNRPAKANRTTKAKTLEQRAIWDHPLTKT